VLKRMVLKRVLDAVGRLENAMKTLKGNQKKLDHLRIFDNKEFPVCRKKSEFTNY